MMRNIEEMVNLSKQRPGMYFGKKNTNTEELYTFLNGFYTGKSTSEIITELDMSFYRNFSYYTFDWMDKNNKLNNKEFSFEWYKFFDSFGEEGISLFYLLCKKFFSEYHSHSLQERYYFNDTHES